MRRPHDQPPLAPLPKQVMARYLPPGLSELEQHQMVQSLTRAARSNRRHPCELCGDTSGECIAYVPDQEPGTTHTTHLWCSNYRGEDALYREGWGFKGGISYVVRKADGSAPASTPARSARRGRESIPLADAATQDRMLREVARRFGLSDAHRRELVQRRGYRADEIGPDARWPFASLPADLDARICVPPTPQEERELLGVLGFETDGRRTHAYVAFLPRVAGAALLEFLVGADGLWCGLEYAPDTPEMDNKGRPIKRKSPARQEKTGRYGVSIPRHDTGRRVVYTEGGHKAKIACDHFEAPAVNIQGAACYTNVLAAAHALDPEKRRTHLLELDATEHSGKHETAALNALVHEGYRVELARWDATRGNGPDDAILAGATITTEPYHDAKAAVRNVKFMSHVYPWMRREETPDERDTRLDAEAQRISEDVRAHLDERSPQHPLLAIASAPGLGKTHQVSALGAEYDLAWIAQRHDMFDAAAPFAQHFRHIQPCTKDNCPAPELHAALVAKGYKTTPMHREHPSGPCPYIRQFDGVGPAWFVTQLVQTSYPARHSGGIIVDELNLTEWLKERAFTILQLRATASTFPERSVPDRFLRALEATITDVQAEAARARAHHEQLPPEVHGRTLFERLNARCDGQLASWMLQLGHIRQVKNEHPTPSITLDDEESDPEAAVRAAEALPEVILPHVYRAFKAELATWADGGGKEWNSRLRLGPTGGRGGEHWALYVMERTHFGLGKDAVLPPLAVLDGTADETIYERLFGSGEHGERRVRVVKRDVDPPPHTQHIAVRTKRNGIISLTQNANPVSKAKHIARLAAEIRYLLKRYDRTGRLLREGGVALITHAGCERELAEAVGIPFLTPDDPRFEEQARTGHFWGLRGSNRLSECPLTFIVGTPALEPAQVLRLARGLYAEDAAPILEGSERVDDQWRYLDLRVQGLADWLSKSELTQCAHRSRPLRHDGRVVVTMCLGDVGFLPITTEITHLPQLVSDGELRSTAIATRNESRFRAACEHLAAQGIPVNVHTIAATAHASLRAVCAWWKSRKNQDRDACTSGYQLWNKRSNTQSGNLLNIDITSPTSAEGSTPQISPGSLGSIEVPHPQIVVPSPGSAPSPPPPRAPRPRTPIPEQPRASALVMARHQDDHASARIAPPALFTAQGGA